MNSTTHSLRNRPNCTWVIFMTQASDFEATLFFPRRVAKRFVWASRMTFSFNRRWWDSFVSVMGKESPYSLKAAPCTNSVFNTKIAKYMSSVACQLTMATTKADCASTAVTLCRCCWLIVLRWWFSEAEGKLSANNFVVLACIHKCCRKVNIEMFLELRKDDLCGVLHRLCAASHVRAASLCTCRCVDEWI